MFSEERNPEIPFYGGRETSLVPANRALSPTAIVAAMSTNRANSMTARNATALAVHEQFRALLTKAVLDNTAALSALEAHLYRVAPFGEERYRTIIDAYTISSVMRLGRW